MSNPPTKKKIKNRFRVEGIRLCHLLYLNDKKWNGKILNYYNNAIFGIKNEKKNYDRKG